MKAIITGSSGFIGHNISKKLLEKGVEVVGIDNHNDYYDKKLKRFRNEINLSDERFKFIEMNLNDAVMLNDIFLRKDQMLLLTLRHKQGFDTQLRILTLI